MLYQQKFKPIRCLLAGIFALFCALQFMCIEPGACEEASDTAPKSGESTTKNSVVNDAALLNNKGVGLLTRHDFIGAAELFQDALKVCPGYTYARSNLAITYNNYALTQTDPDAAIKYFNLAAFLDPEDTTVPQNLNKVLSKKYGGEQESFAALVKLAEQFVKNGDTIGAAVAYRRAVAVQPDAIVQSKLDKLQLPEPWRSIAAAPPASASPEADVDFGPYMARLQRRIKRHWFPPKGDETRRMVVCFKVNQDGTVPETSIKLTKPSGVDGADRAAIQAVSMAAPMEKLPKGSPSSVDIQFTFDYNVFGGNGKPKPEPTTASSQSSGDTRTTPDEPKTGDKASAEGPVAKNKLARPGHAKDKKNGGLAIDQWLPYALAGLALCFVLVFVFEKKEQK